MTLGERIKELRLQNGMSQQQLGDLTGCTRAAVSIWELDKQMVSVDNLLELCEIFDVNMDYLLGRTKITKYTLSLSEMRLIEKYRGVDEDTRDDVLKLLSEK